MFCPNCGAQNSDTATFCSSCGTALKPSATADRPVVERPAFGQPVPPAGGLTPANDNGVNIGLGILAFCLPIVGVVLFFVWRDERPKTARQIIMISAVSFGLSLLFYLASSMTAAAVGAY
jgi:hypothetical protein